MVDLVEVDAVFRDCVKQRKARGASASAAQQACSYPPGFLFVGDPVSEPEQPAEPEMEPPEGDAGDAGDSGGAEAPPAGVSGDSGSLKARKTRQGLDRRSKGGLEYPQHPAYGFFKSPTGEVAEASPKATGSRPGQSVVGFSRWGGRNLTPGFVPGGLDPRAEAELWAKEVSRNGQRPVTDQGAWEVHAARMGLTPDQIDQGWRYIETVFNRRLRPHGRMESVVADLGEIFEFSGQPYGGYNLPMPHAWKQKIPRHHDVDPSWPWRTKSAQRVYQKALEVIREYPDLEMPKVYERALALAKVSPFDMPPEDDAIMGMALQWAMVGKDAQPQAPDIATGRSAYGMKGTKPIPIRGAP